LCIEGGNVEAGEGRAWWDWREGKDGKNGREEEDEAARRGCCGWGGTISLVC
jgi:hypothetical protein